MRDKYSDVRRAPPYLAPVISLRLNTSAAFSLPTLRQDLGASEEKLPLSTFVGTASRKPNHIEEISGEADGLLPEEWAQGYPKRLLYFPLAHIWGLLERLPRWKHSETFTDKRPS